MRYLFITFFILFTNNISLLADSQGGRQSSAISINGISLNDSMLDFFSLSEIKEAIRKYKISYPSDKFYDVSFISSDEEFYQLSVSFKKNDNKYKVYSLRGIKLCDTQRECKKIYNDQVNSIRKLMPNAVEKEYDFIYPKSIDQSGKSIAYVIDFVLASKDTIRVFYRDWSSNVDFVDNVTLNITSNKYLDFLKYDAYK